jgi:PQQ-dependent catabolism-associated CXXCW motif protein
MGFLWWKRIEKPRPILQMRSAMKRALTAAIFAGAFCFGALAQTLSPSEPSGYRLDDYRSKTPETLVGATVIDTARAFELWRDKEAVFIDALPHAPKPANLPQNVVWRDKPHFDIPGSIWLPDTGYGELAPRTQHYFEAGLAGATSDNRNRSVVFYCLANCWMSWNAAKRALSLGYTKVYWYPEGMDGWAAAGHPQEERKPHD